MESMASSWSMSTGAHLSVPGSGRAFSKIEMEKEKRKQTLSTCKCAENDLVLFLSISLLFLKAIKSYSATNGWGITAIYKWDVKFNSPRLEAERARALHRTLHCSFQSPMSLVSVHGCSIKRYLWTSCWHEGDDEEKNRKKANKTFCSWEEFISGSFGISLQLESAAIDLWINFDK